MNTPLDKFPRPILERERIHLILIDEAEKGLADIEAGNVQDARSAIQAMKRRRAAKSAFDLRQ